MRRKLKDIGYMKRAAYDIGGRMADEYIRNFNRRETESAKPKEKKEMKNSLTDLNNYLLSSWSVFLTTRFATTRRAQEER